MFSSRWSHILQKIQTHPKTRGLATKLPIDKLHIDLHECRTCCHQCLHIYITDITYSIASNSTRLGVQQDQIGFKMCKYPLKRWRFELILGKLPVIGCMYTIGFQVWFYCIMFQDLVAITIIPSIPSITSLSSLSSLRIFGRSFCAPGEASSAPKVRLQSSPSSLHRCRSPPSPPAKANGRSKPDMFLEKWFGTLCYRVEV